jgi:hypothetical protein
MATAKRHQLILFFVLAYALTWVLWIPAVVLQESIGLLHMLLFMVGMWHVQRGPERCLWSSDSGPDAPVALRRDGVRLGRCRSGLNWTGAPLLQAPQAGRISGGARGRHGGSPRDLSDFSE